MDCRTAYGGVWHGRSSLFRVLRETSPPSDWRQFDTNENASVDFGSPPSLVTVRRSAGRHARAEGAGRDPRTVMDGSPDRRYSRSWSREGTMKRWIAQAAL